MANCYLISRFSALLFSILLLCACTPKSQEEDFTPGDIRQQKLVEELNARLSPIVSSSPGQSTSDLSIFDFLGQAKIVGMGEATHGSKEFFQMKHRLFQYLVEKHGFRIFAFEYDFGSCLILDDMLQSGQGSITDYMRQYMGFWTWRTEEVVQFFQWMQDYNRNKPADQKLHVVGVDCQMTLYGVPQLVKMLNLYDSNYAQSVNDRLGSLSKLNIYPGATLATIQPLRDNILPKLNEIARELQDRSADIAKVTSSTHNQLIQNLFQTLVQAEVVQYSNIVNVQNGYIFREKYMADNLSWIFEHFGNVKIALWAHNEHVCNNDNFANFNTPSQGGHLRKKYGDAYQIVGFSFANGQFTAYNPNSQRVETVSIGAPIKSSVNHLFSLTKEKSFAIKTIDLAISSLWSSFLSGSPLFLSIGAVFDANTSTNYFAPTRIDQRFDVLIHFNESTATKPLFF